MHAALRQCEHQVVYFRRVWKAWLATSVLTPVLFLAAIGLGVGHSVDQGQGGPGAASLGSVRYVAFLAPGLLAATAMQGAASESLWPVQGGFLWQGFFPAAAATPLRGVDIVGGWLVWITGRVALSATLFLVVASAFGALVSPWAVLAVPAAALTGLAFGAPLTAFTATRMTDASFPLIMRFGVLPLFLFSGVFYPVTQLPAVLRPVIWLTPLWHGVELCRSLTLGTVEPGPSLLHVAVLVAFSAAGLAAGARTFSRRLAS
ncbi:MAG: ABC transporter permease [Acidimicrobiales bacterium]